MDPGERADPAPLRVLVAADDARTRDGLLRLLERHGFAGILAKDGQEALEILLTPNAPQIALLDWEMPRLDGLHVSKAVRTLPATQSCYIIMMTGRENPSDMLAAFASGVDDFVLKPLDGDQLLARLKCGARVARSHEQCARRISELEKALDAASHGICPHCSHALGSSSVAGSPGGCS